MVSIPVELFPASYCSKLVHLLFEPLLLLARVGTIIRILLVRVICSFLPRQYCIVPYIPLLVSA